MIRKLTQITLFLAAILLFSACSDLTAKEIARIPINPYDPSGMNYRSSNVSLKKGDNIAVWTNLDMQYKGALTLEMTLEMYKPDGELYQAFVFNPFVQKMTTNEVKKTSGNETQWKFSAKNEEFTVKDSGRYKFVAVLKTSLNTSLRMISKPEIVLKRKK